MGTSRRRRFSSNKLLAAIVVVAVLAGIGGGSLLAYYNLKGRADRLQAVLTVEIQAGQREFEAGKASLTDANSKHDPALITAAITHFANAKTQFLAASQAADSSRLLSTLELIPAVGGLANSRRVAVDGLAAMGAALSDAGQDLANLDGLLIKPAGTGQAGKNLLTVLDQANAGLPKIHADLLRAQRGAAKVDPQVVPAGQRATFVKARGLIDSALSGLDEFALLVPPLTEILGGNGSRTYLVEQVDPAELRAGGGFIGTYSLIQANQGTVTVISSGDAYRFADPRPSPGQPGFIPMVGPYREVIPNVSWSFVDSNLYPDFASNAKAAENFVQPRIGGKLDGVISMDYYVVAKMLELTGPFTIPGSGITVDANSIIKLLVTGSLAADAVHKAIVGALAGPLLQRVASLPADRWPALIGALNSLAATRHVQAYFNAELADKEMARVGWSGSVNPTGSQDFMMEVESNYYGDKANYFLTRHYTVVLTRQGSTLHHAVTVDFVNTMPFGISDRTPYKADLRFYVGTGTSMASDNLRPVKFPNPPPLAGTDVMDGWLPDVACCGGRGQAVFEYDTPWLADGRGLDKIYWQKQPGTVVDKVDITWNDGAGHVFKTAGDLSQDRLVTLSPSGVSLTAGQPAQATIPSLSLG